MKIIFNKLSLKPKEMLVASKSIYIKHALWMNPLNGLEIVLDFLRHNYADSAIFSGKLVGIL